MIFTGPVLFHLMVISFPLQQEGGAGDDQHTEPALWTKAPTTGFSVPLMARTMAMKFSTMEKVMLP